MAAKKDDSMVMVRLPKVDDGRPPYVVASVNGKVYQIQRGVSVKVPRELAEVLRNSDIAAEAADSFIAATAN